MTLRIVLAYLIMGCGSFFAVITVVGLIRFPDVYTRIHAGAVVLTISGVLFTLGAALYIWELFLSLKLLLIALFFLISNPMATHAIARASYQKKIALPKEQVVDEYSEYLEEKENDSST
ncbi:MAG: monovalent cation/H(+) antiporter subunit G [Halanaerobiales bacterium]